MLSECRRLSERAIAARLTAAALVVTTLLALAGRPARGRRFRLTVATGSRSTAPSSTARLQAFRVREPGRAQRRGRAAGGRSAPSTGLNPFILKGVPVVGTGQLFETLTVRSSDEASAEYGLVAESIEVPADRSWVTFTLRPRRASMTRARSPSTT